MPSFDLHVRFVYFRAKGARAGVNFPAISFCILQPELLELLSCFLWISWKINPLNEKKKKKRQTLKNTQLRSLSVKKITKNKEKIWMLGGKMVIEKWRF